MDNHILHPRKLNLDVPPLSTRRPLVDPTSSISKSSTTNMVPFSWERTPGVPKERKPNDDFEPLPSPRLPPGWRQPPPSPPMEVDSLPSTPRPVERRKECFSDAIDIFSLAESIDDDMEMEFKATKGRMTGVQAPNEYCSSNFIIERFLPDARALAEASIMNNKELFLGSPESSSSFSRAVSIGRSSHSFKGCGLGSLLPWKMRSKPCAKSSVCDTIIGTNLKQKR